MIANVDCINSVSSNESRLSVTPFDNVTCVKFRPEQRSGLQKTLKTTGEPVPP